MTFLHFSLSVEGKSLEWGFVSDNVPATGDAVSLYVRTPDSPDDDSELLNCIVIKRDWFYKYYASDSHDEVFIDLDTTDEIPDGYVPDSEAWPSISHGERERKWSELFKRIEGDR